MMGKIYKKKNKFEKLTLEQMKTTEEELKKAEIELDKKQEELIKAKREVQKKEYKKWSQRLLTDYKTLYESYEKDNITTAQYIEDLEEMIESYEHFLFRLGIFYDF